MADAQIKITADTSQAERALGSLTSTLKTLAGIAIGGSVARDLAAMAIETQNLTNKLLSVSSGTVDAKAKFDSLAATAGRTGSSLGGTVDLFQKLAMSATFAGSNNELLAGNTEALMKVVENFNKTLQLSGASSTEAAAATYQFAQAMQKGSLNGDEFRSMAESNGYFIKLLTKELGISATELRQWSQNGKLSAEVIANALNNSGKIAEDYSKRILTIPQAWENFKTAALKALNDIENKTGVLSAIADAIDFLAKNIVGIGIAALTALTVAFVLLNAAALPWIALAVGIVAAVIAVGVAIQKLINFVSEATDLWGAFSAGADKAAKAVANYFGVSYNLSQSTLDYEKKQAEAVKATETATAKKLKTEHQRNQMAIDLDTTLRQQIGTMNAENALTAQGNGLVNLKLEGEKAVAKEREKYAKTGEAILPKLAQELALATQNKILAAEKINIDKQLLDIRANTANLAVMDNNEQAIGAELDKLRLSVSAETFNIRKQEFEQAVRSNKLAEANRQILKENADLLANTQTQGNLDPRAATIEAGVLANRQKYGTAYTAELEAQDRLLKGQIFDLDQQNQIRRTLNDLTRQQTALETASRAGSLFGGTKEGMGVEQQRQMDALQLLRAKGLIDEKSYQDQRILMMTAATDAMIQLDNKVFENKKLQEIQAATGTQFGYETQKAMAKEGADFEKKSALEKTQFGIEQGANLFATLGQQNRQAFEASKAMNIAMAIMNTYMGATKALATYPWPFGLIAAAAAVAAGMAQVGAIRSQQYTGRATGGPVASGTPYIVGEQGRELFVPSTAGTIIPNGKMDGAGGGTTVNFNITANDTQGFDDLLIKRRGLITQVIRDAQLERGQRLGA